MAKKINSQHEFSRKRTELAQKRTELAHERSILAYLRTATTIILFGIAFFGFSEEKWDFLFTAGIISIIAGILFIIIAIMRGFKHMEELQRIKYLVEKIAEHP